MLRSRLVLGRAPELAAVVIVVAVLIAGLTLVFILRAGRVLASRRGVHSTHRHQREMEAPRGMSEGGSASDRQPTAGSADRSDGLRTQLEWRRTGSSAPRATDRTREPGEWPLQGSPDPDFREQLRPSSVGEASGVAREVARVIGLDEAPARDLAVEANARVTGATGLVLIVLLFLEGLTIPFIGRLVSWHILLGLVLVPPLVLKMASVLWRFARYYLHDPRYAPPDHRTRCCDYSGRSS